LIQYNFVLSSYTVDEKPGHNANFIWAGIARIYCTDLAFNSLKRSR